jgi:CxxC motif-containing protein (DUF1111 family)
MAVSAQAVTPDYNGTVCPIDGGVRVEVYVEANTSFMLIFPTPPGNGGWVMNQDAPGVFSHFIPDLAAGDALAFSLILQNPQQYTYPEHHLTIEPDCATFERDDVMPPPPRGFWQDVVLRDEQPWFTFTAGAESINVDRTTEVQATYRLDDGALTTITLQEVEPGLFEAPIPGASADMQMEYWFSQLIGIQVMHSAMLERNIGEPWVEPDWPILTKRSGRFRDRHPNEWRFDNFVADYGQGRTFELEVTDWGNRMDVTVTVDPGAEVGRMDFKRFVYNDPYSDPCNRALTSINMVMEKNGNVFTGSVEDITPGAIIDFDFTFIDVTSGQGVSSYYSEFYYYRVGAGAFGPETPDPRRSAVGRAGATNVFSYRFGLAQHAPTMTHADLNAFLDGKVIFETDYDDAELLNFNTHFDCCAGPLGPMIQTSPVFRDGMLGPRYNAASCVQCHMMDGRGPTPYTDQDLFGLVAQLSIPGQGQQGEPIPHPLYGRQLDVASEGNVQAEGRLQVSYEQINGTFDDGTPYTLRKPVYHFKDLAYGSLGKNIPDDIGSPGYPGVAHFSPRIAPMLSGLGMLEAVSIAEILSREDPDDTDGDGISGRANRVWDETAQGTVVGRFGWKANQPSLIQQAAEAFRTDLGITSPMAPNHDCGVQQTDCNTDSGGPELQAHEVDLVAAYLQGLTLPPRQNYQDPQARAGMHLFKQANCQACHIPTLQTGSSYPIVALRNITIEPFTDLLLHDMGPGLADGRPQFQANGNEWRTPPLWALSYVQHALGVPTTCDDPTSGGAEPNFLHDGRARTLMEAILWHGGEAQASKQAVLAMSQQEREDLLAYVAYPFADPIFNEGDGDDDNLPACQADLDGNGVVDVRDLLLMLINWGQPGPADLSGDGMVESEDLLILLGLYGEQCP